MGVIPDTSVWVDLEQARITPQQLAAIVGTEPIYLTPVTIAELRYGVKRAPSQKQRRARAAALAKLETKNCLKIDRRTGNILGDIKADADSRGRPTDHRIQDLWIASLALQYGFKVITRNRRDFDDIPGLTVLSLGP